MASGKSSLASLFSDENKANYERINKPKEFVKIERKKRRLDDINDGDQEIEEIQEVLPKRVKKPKHKQRKPPTNEPSDTNPAIVETEQNVELEGHEKDARTIFVGNIPITETVTSIKTYFGQFGQVESVRLRSVPTAGTAVNEAGNQQLVKKVCVYQGKFGDQKGSFNAYVVFKTTGSVQASFAANNRLMGTRHIRVDSMNPTLFPPRTSVFLGGLPFYTDEEELREHFAKLLPNGQDDIVGIRLIRDQETLVGKGIGYLALANHEAVMKALLLDKSKFKKREIRVTSCGKRTKRTEQKKRETSHPTSTEVTSTEAPLAEAEEGAQTDEPSKKKRKKEDRKNKPPNPAERRMQMKKAIQQIVKKNAQRNKNNNNKKKSKVVNVKRAVKKLEKMNQKK